MRSDRRVVHVQFVEGVAVGPRLVLPDVPPQIARLCPAEWSHADEQRLQFLAPAWACGENRGDLHGRRHSELHLTDWYSALSESHDRRASACCTATGGPLKRPRQPRLPLTRSP